MRAELRGTLDQAPSLIAIALAKSRWLVKALANIGSGFMENASRAFFLVFGQ